MPSRSSSTFLWKISLALDIPKGTRVMQNRPRGEMNAVSFAHSSSQANCQYPPEASSFEKKTEPASFASTCGIAGIMYLSRCTTLFSCLRSMQILTFSGFLGAATIGAHHGVGSVIFLITPSISTHFRLWEAMV